MRNDKGIIIAGAAIAVLLDVVLSPSMPFFSSTPNFMIAYSIAIGMLSRGNVSYGIAFVLGMIADLLGYGPVGLLSILLIAAVAVERTYLNDFARSKGFSGFIALICTTLGVEVLHAFGTVIFMAGIDPIDAVVFIALPCSLLDCVLVVVLYSVMGRILIPRSTGYGNKPPRLRRF